MKAAERFSASYMVQEATFANMLATRLTIATASFLVPYSPADAKEIWAKNTLGADIPALR